MIKVRVKLSDKILLVFFVFSAFCIVLINFLAGISATQLFILSTAIFIFTFIAAYCVSRSFSRRISGIIFKIEEMAAGNLKSRIKATGHDEVGQLAHALNELMSRLQTGVALDVSKHSEIDRAKTDFVSLASHQLRTPLSIIKWYIDFLLAGDAGEINADQEKYLKEVYKSNERLIELVNALLDTSRIDLGTFSIEPEPTDIVEKMNSALSRYMGEITRKRIKLQKKLDALPSINLDPRLTKIVFENIISNAVKYTPEKGIIRIVMKKTDKDILIKISDTGCGIPREQQPKIFTKLFRADNVKRIENIGTGLGLYIVKAVIEKSGGRIWFESPSLDLLLEAGQRQADVPLDKRNRGTTFFITIPLKGMRKRLGAKKLSS